MSFETIDETIGTYRPAVIGLQRSLVARPALSPDYGEPAEVTGELRKVEFLERYLREHGIIDLRRIDADDPRAPGGVRPNLMARVPGRSNSRTVWVMAHTDVVPPGDLDTWSSDPFELRVDGDRLFGRGVEDNHQGLVSGVLAARALVETGTVPAHDLALLFIADEECGSTYGIQHVLEHGNPFREDDLILVPDGGSADGSEIEVAEKSILWARFKTTGKQTHASTPERGVNAMRAGAHLVVALDRLHRLFDRTDPVFLPPISTFEPTKKEANVPNINTIPGDDVFCLDCRVLPCYPLEDVERAIREIADEVAAEAGVSVEISLEQREEAAPPTAEDATVVQALATAVREVYGVEAKPIGIGGGTVAAYLRHRGLPCVVWSRMDETMHGPDECSRISNTLGDAKVIAHLALRPEGATTSKGRATPAPG
jgi:succinyl-diaminopimelate desuccinylase